MIISGGSNIGRVRSSNQDSFVTEKISDSVGFIVVCDGMGGANGGNIASEVATNIISEHIKSAYRENMSSNSMRYLLMSAVIAANAEIYDRAQEDDDLLGMGTTVVAAIVVDKMAHIVHVGDSRAYIVSSNNIEQITRDHSVIQSMIENGEITEQEAKNHPNRNVITRALGVRDKVDVDYNEIVLSEDDILLICTDGLSNFVEDKKITKIIKKHKISEYPDVLIDTANNNGGGDNITVVTLSVKE
ncbi:MAG: Stp1/IreP family PP2C-type Ser/Thr phosphatase [Clostridia bacterium]|nr:Stp1/IreP family PP2C-type Ser/Thr phosphatase [Clostridia bacterium]